MNKKILLGCFEIPGYGGASTSSYKLFEMMQKDGYDINFLNIISESDESYFKYVFGESLGNPKGLIGVHNCFLQGNNYGAQPKLTEFINKLKPDIMVGVGWIAALIMKNAAPKKKLIYLTTGCEQLKTLIIKKLTPDFLSFFNDTYTMRCHRGIFSQMEYKAIIESDYVITHSSITLDLHTFFFRHHNGKISPRVIWFAEWICQEAREYSYFSKPFEEREIDLIFIASNWNRPEKNIRFVKKILSRFNKLNIHVIGELENKLARATCHGLITERKIYYQLLGNSKTIICPSLFDAAPGTLFEASIMGCNIITSKNCGNWQLCNEDLLVHPYTINKFSEKIALSLSKKYHDHIDYFIGTDSYKNLLEIIQVF